MVEMGSVIDTDAPLDYVEFQLFLSRDRYEAGACSGDMVETVASGILGQLVRHIPKLKDLFFRGSKASFQIQCPKDPDSSHWFTKATVIRFLHIVGSVNILNTTKSIQDEITQLEESRKFHLSLYIKDESDTAPSDASKNELLRAIELRLTALKLELSTVINRAAGSSCFPEDIFNMEKLAQHLGDMNLRNTFRNFLELGARDQKVDMLVNSNYDTVDNSDEENQPKIALKYGVSPGKAAQIERQNTTERECSSESSEDDQPSVVKNRSLARLASPRRSSSPMRRVQIGKSGSRKAPALTIKSLNYFPGRDKTQTYRGADSYSSEEEGSKNPQKRSNSNATRISVKDAINLFENKQKDHTSDAQVKRPTFDTETVANKSVLRRLSSGVGDPEIVSESDSQLNTENWEVETPEKRMESKTDFEIIDGDNKPVEDAKVDGILDVNEGKMSKPMDNEPDILIIQYEEDDDKLTDSSEWNRQKEAELNEMLTKMMQTKPRKTRNVVPNKNGPHDGLREKRGGHNDQYKGKKDEKLRGEIEKRPEKDSQFKAMQQVLEQRKAAMASANITRSRSSLSKPEKVRKNLTQSVNPKKESPKSHLTKKASSINSPSSVRKSWSSTPSPRSIMGISPAKTPCGTSSPSTTPTRRKPHPGPVGPQPSPKVDRILQRSKPKPVKATQADCRKNTKSSVEKQPTILKNTKILKPRSQSFCDNESSKDVAKPSFYTKVTKKSSVVPLESKPSLLDKGSVVNPSSDPVVKTKSSSPLKKPVKKLENPILVEKNGVANTFDLISQQIPDKNIDLVSEQIPDENLESDDSHASLQPEVQLTTQQIIGDIASCEQVITNSDDISLRRMSQPALKIGAEEDLTISPTAWVEKDEYRDLCIPPDDITCVGSSIVNVEPVETANPRVRHSLSQMLLQESELDMTEWGKSGIPPSLVYQNDAPKGFKRLLKFPRKIKGDQNSTGWSSPSVFSEGEDDSEKSKSFGKKNADASLKKAALHASNYGHQITFLGEGHGRDFSDPQRLYDQLKLDNFGVQSSSNRLQNHISGVATTTKATRSFFSFSAFRGNKPNQTKIC